MISIILRPHQQRLVFSVLRHGLGDIQRHTLEVRQLAIRERCADGSGDRKQCYCA